MVFQDLPEQSTTLLNGQLHSFIERIIKELYPLTVVNNCFISNDIPYGISIVAEEKLVMMALESIITEVVQSARDSQIQLTAKEFGDVILIQVKDHNTFDRRRLSVAVQNLQGVADMLSGFVGLSYPSNKSTTVAFSFPNLAHSAC